MPASPQQTIQVNFSKGLITESSELNFPKEASVDELNCALHVSGARSKRLGVQVEPGDSGSPYSVAPEQLVTKGRWYNVGNNADTEYVVIQYGSKLYFYQITSGSLAEGIVPISNTNPAYYSLDLTAFASPYGTGAGMSKVSMTSINGVLVVVSPQIEAFYISQDATTKAFTTTLINFKVRDFTWLGSRTGYSTQLATASVTNARKYDTANVGWAGTNGAAALAAYSTGAGGFYPPLTHPWYSGKTAAGTFDYATYIKVYSGTTLIVNGHFILDLYNKDRSTASGIAGIATEVIKTRFSSVATYAGRVFYTGIDDKIYFTQLIEDNYSLGDCYQKNDPTSEEISDLLDTDGGWVTVSGAVGIKAMQQFGSALLIFADNGVWKISGVDDVFRATEFSIYKITDFGLAIRDSLVSGSNGLPFWWSYNGIHTIVVTDNGAFQEVSLSKGTIQSYWNSIEALAKAFVTAVHDATNNKVYWLYPDNDYTRDYKMNRVLVFDIDLNAFYPWRIADDEGITPYVIGLTYLRGKGSSETVFNVVDSSGNQVVDSSDNDVVATMYAGTISASDIVLVCLTPTLKVSFARFSETAFLDWGTVPYEAYIDTAYSFVADLGRMKSSSYITTFCKQTETGWERNGTGYTPVRNSSLLVSTYWDFNKTASVTPQEAYRLEYMPIVDETDLTTFNYPKTVISSRLKLRGRGKVVKVRYLSPSGKDFYLLGYETLDKVNPSY